MNFEEARIAHYRFRQQALSNPGTHEILTAADLDRPGSIGIIFGTQHMPRDMTLNRMQLLYDVGVRVMALAYQGTTEYGNGFAVPLGGLTQRGGEVIRMMADVGMILDLSHANSATATGALTLISRQNIQISLMASHSGFNEEFRHERNLTSSIAWEIRYLKGHVGIPAVTFMLTKKLAEDRSYLPAFAQHVARAIAVCGAKTVGIGSDCIHGNMTMFEANNYFEEMSRMLNASGAFGAYFPDRPTELIAHGQEMFTVFERALAGFETEIRAGVLGENFMAFLRRSLPQA
jgi:microsomal dipeptidase-like Zn-dependent dipeptidase